MMDVNRKNHRNVVQNIQKSFFPEKYETSSTNFVMFDKKRENFLTIDSFSNYRFFTKLSIDPIGFLKTIDSSSYFILSISDLVHPMSARSASNKMNTAYEEKKSGNERKFFFFTTLKMNDVNETNPGFIYMNYVQGSEV